MTAVKKEVSTVKKAPVKKAPVKRVAVKRVAVKRVAKAKFAKFAERVLQSKEDKEQLELSWEIEDAEKQLQEDITASERALMVAKRTLETSYGKLPLVSQNILDAQDEVESLEEGVKKLKSLLKLLF